MDRVVYDRMAEHDSTHWWYLARRDILRDFITRYAGLPKDARILEIGCGTGHNLPMLAEFGEIDAIEIDGAAREIASGRLGKPLSQAPLPQLEGIARGRYDLIAVLDVVEHVADDTAALAAMAACLKPGGHVLMTVPAHPWMWSAHDVVNHHHRRYTRATLRQAIAGAGMRPVKLSWFNSILFPIAAAARIAGKLTGREDSDDTPPARPVNWALRKVFGLERYVVGRVPMPPGVSLIALAAPSDGTAGDSAR